MATRIFAANPNGNVNTVTNAVGPTATSGIIAVVVDLASNVTDGTATRGPDRQEVLDAIEAIRQKIIATNWPPA